MIIISNGFFDNDDEGSIKVAQCLAKRCRQRDPRTSLVAVNCESSYADHKIRTNKLFLSRRLWKLLRTSREKVLYIPSTSGTKASILRTLVLTAMSAQPVKVLFVMEHPVNVLFRFLLKCSRAQVITLSDKTHGYYSTFVSDTVQLHTGVDTSRFVPADRDKRRRLREKYGFSQEDKILLHVGHMNVGRNLSCFADLGSQYKILLVTSTVTKAHQDGQLLKKLRACENITVIDQYIGSIEEVYQLSDVYVFPVLSQGHCIDTPLSALEALSCNLPLVTSDYGELFRLADTPGIVFLDSFERDSLEQAVDQALSFEGDVRGAVMPYDWAQAVETVMDGGAGKKL